MKARRIEGKITLTDGTVSEFSVFTDGGWQQWGATKERLGASVDILEAVVRGLLEDDLLASSDDPEDENLKWFTITSPWGTRRWQATDEAHAREQHELAFADDPDEEILSVSEDDETVDPVTGWVEHREGE